MIQEKLESLQPLTIPHFWDLTYESSLARERENVAAICRVTGGVSCSHTSPASVETAMDMAERGAKVAMFVNLKINQDKFTTHDKLLKQRWEQGIKPDIILIHNEQNTTDAKLVSEYAELFRGAFPSAILAWYGYPAYSFSPFGSAFKNTYPTPPSRELNVADIYTADVSEASVSLECLLQHDNGGPESKPILPFVSHAGFYRSKYSTPTGFNWHWDVRARRTPDAWWNLGRLLSTRKNRFEGIAGVWLWKSFYSMVGGVPISMDMLLEDFTYYVQGWHQQPLVRS